MGREVSAAKTQWLHSRALERVAPSYHPDVTWSDVGRLHRLLRDHRARLGEHLFAEARITAPRPQHPIPDNGQTRTQILDPKAATTGSFNFEFDFWMHREHRHRFPSQNKNMQ